MPFTRYNSLACRRDCVLAVTMLGLSYFSGCKSDDADTSVNPPIVPAIESVVSGVAVDSVNQDHLFISWTAPKVKGNLLQGRTFSCDIRYAKEPLTLETWFSAPPGLFPPLLADSGVTQQYTVSGAYAGETTFVAIRITDQNALWGPIAGNLPTVVPSVLSAPANFDFFGTGIIGVDFDRDGDSDLVVINGNSYSDNLVTLTNDSRGNFEQKQSLSIVGTSQLVRAANLNQDEYPDLAVSCYGKLYTFLNDGTGSFVSLDSQAMTNNVGGMQPGDLNGDGRAEIVAGSYNIPVKGSAALGLTAVYFCDESGKFTEFDTLNTLLYSNNITLYDADGDGDLDIAVTYSTPAYIALYYNDGTGRNWTEYSGTDLSIGASSVTAGDLNNDGRMDLVGANIYDHLVLTAAMRTDQGSYTTQVSYPGAGGFGWVYLGDFSGDGYLDVVRADSSVILHVNDRLGGFSGAARYLTGVGPFSLSLAVADFDGDGHLDIAALQNSPHLYILLSTL